MGKASSVEDYKQSSIFQSLGKTLLQDPYEQHVEKPLAYWVLPSDRRLPLAFMGRSLRDLLNTPFEQLTATPGIGRKKIGSLLKLLARVAKESPPTETLLPRDWEGDGKASSRKAAVVDAEFDPTSVSELMWEQWRATVRRHQIGFEKLGRLAPSLQGLPTVLWHTPLSMYLDTTLAEMRQLKTHGEKRVRVILEVFHAVHEVLAQSRVESHLTLRLVPKFVLPVERWIAHGMASPEKVSDGSVRESLAVPLVEQIRGDCGPTIVRLVEARLGIHTAPQSVKAQAKRMSLTRARVYQLFEEAEQAMMVRWPEGRCLMVLLRQQLEALQPESGGLKLFRAVVDLFFPDAAEVAKRENE